MNPLLYTSSDRSESQEKNSILSSSPKTICNSRPSTITPTSYHQISSAPKTQVVININTPLPYSSIPGHVPHQVARNTYVNRPDPISDDAKDPLTSFSSNILGNFFKDPEFVELSAKKVSGVLHYLSFF